MADPKNVLIVEDSMMTRKILEKMVTTQGHTVTMVATADEALGQLQSGSRPDLIITDVNTGGNITGIAMLEKLRNLEGDQGAHIPVIVRSSELQHTNADGAKMDSAEYVQKLNASFLPKSSPLPTLVNLINEKLGGKAADSITR